MNHPGRKLSSPRTMSLIQILLTNEPIQPSRSEERIAPTDRQPLRRLTHTPGVALAGWLFLFLLLGGSPPVIAIEFDHGGALHITAENDVFNATDGWYTQPAKTSYP